jgi:hypothetical protein
MFIACVCSVRKLNISSQEFPIPDRAAQTGNGGLYVRTHGLTSSATPRAGAILWVHLNIQILLVYAAVYIGCEALRR